MADPLFGVLPPRFDAFVGHKEAVSRLPEGAVLLAGSATCPVQAFRLGRRVYATQFHPELDVEGLVHRLTIYRDHGYTAAGGLDDALAARPRRHGDRAAAAAGPLRGALRPVTGPTPESLLNICQ